MNRASGEEYVESHPEDDIEEIISPESYVIHFTSLRAESFMCEWRQRTEGEVTDDGAQFFRRMNIICSHPR